MSLLSLLIIIDYYNLFIIFCCVIIALDCHFFDRHLVLQCQNKGIPGDSTLNGRPTSNNFIIKKKKLIVIRSSNILC